MEEFLASHGRNRGKEQQKAFKPTYSNNEKLNTTIPTQSMRTFGHDAYPNERSFSLIPNEAKDEML